MSDSTSEDFCKAIERHRDDINMYVSALDQMYWNNPAFDERLIAQAEQALDLASDALRRAVSNLQRP